MKEHEFKIRHDKASGDVAYIKHNRADSSGQPFCVITSDKICCVPIVPD